MRLYAKMPSQNGKCFHFVDYFTQGQTTVTALCNSKVRIPVRYCCNAPYETGKDRLCKKCTAIDKNSISQSSEEPESYNL
jgi:hypothetical protein